MENIICPRCNKPAYKNRITKGVCFNCYRKFFWKQKLIACKRCGRMKPNQAKGFCAGCYNFLFHMDSVRAANIQKLYNIDFETYNKITKECIICGFDKIVDLHHLDKDRANNSSNNMVGLCPNHHQMLHSNQHKEEVFQALEQKGIYVKRTIEVKNKLKIFIRLTETPDKINRSQVPLAI